MNQFDILKLSARNPFSLNVDPDPGHNISLRFNVFFFLRKTFKIVSFFYLLILMLKLNELFFLDNLSFLTVQIQGLRAKVFLVLD